MLPSLLALSDVMPTGWHCAVAAGVQQGGTAVVVGDGAVGLCAVLAARSMGAEKVIAMSRHAVAAEDRPDFGATHIVADRGRPGCGRGQGAHRRSRRGRGARVRRHGRRDGYGVRGGPGPARPSASSAYPHGVELPVGRMFAKNVGLRGGMAPVRRYLPEPARAGARACRIDPGKVFDLTPAAGPGGRRATGRWTNAGRSRSSWSREADQELRLPGMTTGRHSQPSPQERNVCMP